MRGALFFAACVVFVVLVLKDHSLAAVSLLSGVVIGVIMGGDA